MKSFVECKGSLADGNCMYWLTLVSFTVFLPRSSSSSACSPWRSGWQAYRRSSSALPSDPTPARPCLPDRWTADHDHVSLAPHFRDSSRNQQQNGGTCDTCWVILTSERMVNYFKARRNFVSFSYLAIINAYVFFSHAFLVMIFCCLIRAHCLTNVRLS